MRANFGLGYFAAHMWVILIVILFHASLINTSFIKNDVIS